jgi:hypothetical protein
LRGIAVDQLHKSTNQPDEEKYLSPWLKGEGWRSIVKTHTTTSFHYTHTLPLEGGIALAQLHSSTNGANGEKSTKVHGLMEKDREASSKLVPQHLSSILTHCPLKGA